MIVWYLVTVFLTTDGLVTSHSREEVGPDPVVCSTLLHQRTFTTHTPGSFVLYCEGLPHDPQSPLSR